MIKNSLLAASIALVLAGCGGSDNNTSSTINTANLVDKISKAFDVKAIDGYLANAEIYAGKNCDTLAGKTDKYGTATLDGKFSGQKLCVQAIKGKTIDLSKGSVTKDFQLQAPANSEVITPITTLVVKHMQAHPELSLDDAKQAVAEKFSDLRVSDELLFGDYIAKHKTDTVAQAINIIGAALVDNSEKTTKHMDVLIRDLADQIQSKKTLDNYQPVIKADGSIEVNHKPYINSIALEEIKKHTFKLKLNEQIDPEEDGYLDIFEHDDNDALNFTLLPQNSDESIEAYGLAFNRHTGQLSGTPKLAGKIALSLYATDSKGARSDTHNFVLEVVSDNQAPEVDGIIVKQLESELSQMDLTQDVEIS